MKNSLRNRHKHVWETFLDPLIILDSKLSLRKNLVKEMSRLKEFLDLTLDIKSEEVK